MRLRVPRPIRAPQRLLGDLGQGTGQPDPKKRIHDHIGPAKIDPLQAADRAHGRPAIVIGARIPGQAIDRPEESHIDPPARFGQTAGDDKTVAAVVARTAQHPCPPRARRQIGPLRQQRGDHGAPGCLHQIAPGYTAAAHRLVFHRAHLCGGDDLAGRGDFWFAHFSPVSLNF